MKSEKLLQIIAEPWLQRHWTNLADLIRSNAEFEILRGTIPTFDRALNSDDITKRINYGNTGGLHTPITYNRSVDELISIMQAEILKRTTPAFDGALNFDDIAKRINSGNEGGPHTALTYYRSVDKILSIMQAMYDKKIARQEEAFSEFIASNFLKYRNRPIYEWEQNRERVKRPLEELKSKATKISCERILFTIYVTAVLMEKYKVEIGPVK